MLLLEYQIDALSIFKRSLLCRPFYWFPGSSLGTPWIGGSAAFLEVLRPSLKPGAFPGWSLGKRRKMKLEL